MDEKWQDWLKHAKAMFGILGSEIDVKLQRLLTATGNNPTAEELAALIRRHISVAGIDTIVLNVVTKLKDEVGDLVKTGKSVPRKNRSALA